MKHTSIKLLAAALLVALAPQAFADDNAAIGTAANTTVHNTATVSYQVSGVTQTAEDSNTADFTVDRKIDLSVAKVGGSVSVTPSPASPAALANGVMAFTVTNESNATLDFSLSATNDAGFAPETGYTIYVDKNGATGDDAYVVADDTGTWIDNLASGDSVTVYIVIDLPRAPDIGDGDTSDWTLTAQAAEPSTVGAQGTDITADDAGTGDTAGVDDVFADGTVHDGKESDSNDFTVASAEILVNKQSVVAEDPINGTTNPKAIPGSTVLYCISVTNNGGTDADNVTMTDVIPPNTAYAPSSIKVGSNATCTIADYTAATAEDDDTTGVGDLGGYDDDSPDNPNISGPAVIVNGGTVASGGGVTTMMFEVTVN